MRPPWRPWRTERRRRGVPRAVATRRSERGLLSDLRLPRCRRERLLRLRCWLLLLMALLLLLLRQVMTDHAAGGRAGNGMMAGYVPGNRSHRRTLQATLGLGCTGTEQQSKPCQSRNQHLFDG
jgi:hypothetical protein